MIDLLYLLGGIAIGLIFGYLYFKNAASNNSYTYKKDFLALEKKQLTEVSLLNTNNSVLNERLNNYRKEQESLNSQIISERNKNIKLTSAYSSVNTKCIHLEKILKQQKEEYQNSEHKLNLEFENIAHKILKQNTEEFSVSSKQNMYDILSPLKEKIISFEKKIDETYDKDLRDKLSLKEEVHKLYDLNVKISAEANNLTKALKGDVKQQGNWGELILERILERSGLSKDIEYQREYVCKNNEGKTIRPDVIIRLPDNKHIIIDSKVSLIAYERLVNTQDKDEATRHTKEHLRSIKSHIIKLAEKHYETSDALNTPEFVLMFMPIESSFSVAIQADKDLYNYAWDNKVVVVSPSTLLACLKTVSSIWKYENQNRNVIEIAKQSGALYDKFVSFIEDITKLGKQLDSTKLSYDMSVKKLYQGNGNLVRRAENIRKLGANVKKELSLDTLNKVSDEE